MDRQIPLTPALSLGERENRPRSAGETRAIGLFATELSCSLSLRVRGILLFQRFPKSEMLPAPRLATPSPTCFGFRISTSRLILI